MSHRLGRRALMTWTAAVLYAAFLGVAAFGHDDLLCQPQSQQHCLACVSTQVGATPDHPPVFTAAVLVDAGRAVDFALPVRQLLLAVATGGRSPPASR